MKRKIFNILVILVDMVLINLGFYIAFVMKFDFTPPQYNIAPYIEIIPFITISALLYYDVFGLLSAFKKSLYDTVYSLVLVIMLLCLTTVALTYFNQGFSFPRSILLVTPILQATLLLTWRILVWKNRKNFLANNKVVVVGAPGQNLDEILAKIKTPALNMLLEIEYSCSSDDKNLYDTIDNMDEVFLSSSVETETKEEIISYCMNNGKRIYIIPGLPEILLYKAQMLQFDDIAAFVVDELKLSTMQRFLKRTFDISISLIASLIVLPVIIIVAIVIKMTSKGPIFFIQDRVTRSGKIFKLIKFRTMVDNAEEKTGPVFSSRGDERITSLGKMLRKTRIDELPQLINVLRGEMSIVGPRPERPFFVEQFEKEIPGYNYRTHVKAGITGLAQVLGKYSTEAEDKLRYDLFYIRNYSVLFDIKIILQTANIVFFRKGAEGQDIGKAFGINSVPKEKVLEM